MRSKTLTGVDPRTGEVKGDFTVACFMNKHKNGFGRGWVAMSQDALKDIVANRKQIGGEGLAVLLALTVDAKFNNEFAVVNQSEMADQLGMKRSNVSRSIKRLVELGIILEKKPERGVSKMYCLNPEFAWKGKAKDHVPALNSKVSYELKRRLDERKGY